MFSENPVESYEKFEDFRKNKRKDKNTSPDISVVPFRSKKENTLIEDLKL